MQNGICMGGLFIQQSDGLIGRDHQKFDIATPGFVLNIRADGEPAMNPCPDNQAATTPGDFLVRRKGRMPRLGSELPGRPFLSLLYLPAVQDEVVVVPDPVNRDRSKT